MKEIKQLPYIEELSGQAFRPYKVFSMNDDICMWEIGYGGITNISVQLNSVKVFTRGETKADEVMIELPRGCVGVQYYRT